MVIDTSAVVALLQAEPEASRYEAAIADADDCAMSAATVFECALVLERRHGLEAASRFDALVREAGIVIVPFDTEQLEIARAAFRRFGRGKHPAGLNFGDCFSYALAKLRGEALLYKGNDFAQTDLESAL